MFGFDTIGSATVIVYDGEPLLSTDPWINESAYFGSWGHDYAIPSEQLDAIRRCRFHWFSHGHPDHLNVDSLPELSAATFLLAPHYGQRIEKDLRAMGYTLRVLPERQWVELSPRVRIQTIANANQDSCLLIDVGGHLLIDLNDAPDLGWGHYIRKLARTYSHSYLLQLHGWGGADMANIYSPDGQRVQSIESYQTPIAPQIQTAAMRVGAKTAIPFSSFHRYRRTDSAWANALVPSIPDYLRDARPDWPPILGPFLRVDVERNSHTHLEPRQMPMKLVTPEQCGDPWSDELEKTDIEQLKKYFLDKELLYDHFGFLAFRVGGRESVITLNRDLPGVGLTFEVPRYSLMTAISYAIFDDLLIGNYMRTIFHGVTSLYPNFSPVVAKYGDNGGVRTREDYKRYSRHYIGQDPVGHYFKWAESGAESVLRRAMSSESAMFKVAKKIYWASKRA